MSQLKDTDIKNMKPGGKTKVESLGKSRGALVFRKVVDTTTGYYRYWKGSQSVFIKLGIYKATSKSAGFTLAELRKKALDKAATRQHVAPQDLKEYLEQQERERQQREHDRKIVIEQAEAMGMNNATKVVKNPPPCQPQSDSRVLQKKNCCSKCSIKLNHTKFNYCSHIINVEMIASFIPE